MKRFVICLDGTWNNAASEKERHDGSRVYRPTNVLKVSRATLATDDQGVHQITYYDAGVGAMNRAPNFRTKVIRFFDNKLGGGWGAGFEVNIEEAYTFLASNYVKGDELFVFGFSRGASQARSLCRLIEWVGGFPSKNDVFYVPKLFSRYLEARGQGNGEDVFAQINARRRARDQKPVDPVVPPRIVFLGVWDTVLALGSRIRARYGSTTKSNRFHTPNDPPTIVEKVRHAMAIDETRHDFQPEIWTSGKASDAFEQRWFPGVHSNVGGGLINDSLANCALRWIYDEASLAGLAMNRQYLSFFGEYPEGKASKKSLFYVLGDTVLRPFRGFRGVRDMNAVAGTTLDRSVLARLRANPADHEQLEKLYRPANLLRYLAANPQYDVELDSDLLSVVQALR